MTKPTVAVFTKENPCTKLTLWNCFRGRRGFKKVQVDEAKSVIGANAPRGMIKQGRLVVDNTNQADFYRLTEEGIEWLRNGMRNYLKRHPEQLPNAANVPKNLMP